MHLVGLGGVKACVAGSTAGVKSHWQVVRGMCVDGRAEKLGTWLTKGKGPVWGDQGNGLWKQAK